MGPGQGTTATLTPGVHVLADGTLRYPTVDECPETD
jgi:hypothetical protein